MRVFITGGSGFVGSHLAKRLREDGHQVIILTRKGSGGADFLQGDPKIPGKWQEEVAKCDLLVNLAGASIFGKWTPQYKEELRLSRILTTRNLVDAIPQGARVTLMSTSAVGYYGFRGDEELDESSPPGSDFLAKLAVDWEAEARRAEDKGARVVIMRFGIVLGGTGGALQQMVKPFKWFVGGPIGSGRQWFSWIHIEDLVEAIYFLASLDGASGPFNLTSPNPVRNKDFSKALGRVLGRPACFPTPGFMIKLVLGEFGSVILEGQRVLPKRLLEAGFNFKYPKVDEALKAALKARRP